MLTTLRLTHFVLIDAAEICFEKNLNILTGETGAGKTILMHAIGLLMGQKADQDVIRLGEDVAVIEASFNVEHLPHVQDCLKNRGVFFDPNEEVLIRREISRSSKNRVFINAQQVPSHVLAELGSLLFEIAGQNSTHQLRSLEEQRKLLDTYGSLIPLVNSLSEIYSAEKDLQSKLATLRLQKQQGEVLTGKIQWELEELEALDLDCDEEKLFEEYRLQTRRQELGAKLSATLENLPEITGSLTRLKKELLSDPLFHDAAQHFDSALVHLNEASYSLSRFTDDNEEDPKRFEELEEKLSQINQVKKKYRLNLAEIPSRISALKNQLITFGNLDDEIKNSEKQLFNLSDQYEKIAKELSLKRHDIAKILEEKLMHELRLLNMPYVKCSIVITPREQTSEGMDHVAFYLATNLGEQLASVKSATSGGELARLFLALKILLAKKESIPILIFDEIDSNIGGETATIIGKKLRELSQHRQVFCITHFPQVARFANHHLLIAKQTQTERTMTTIKPLDEKSKRLELLRMMGGKDETLDFLRS